MGQITTKVATLDEWDDVQAALTGGGDGRACQCAWPLMPSAQWRSSSLEERQEMLHAEIAGGPPPGVVAYVDGGAAGWIRVGPRTSQARIPRSRIVKGGSVEPPEDPSVWAVTCFSVRKEHRRKGLNAALLDAAVGYAREAGARVLEGYPIATDTVTPTANELFVGSLSTFLGAGFREIARPTARRVVVALDLAGTGTPR
ncbi:GNAT family N-acetyltransferase [Microbacterium album]|uniref:N-acetyltransferase n=1 Tax=Microbacterium album TaxID=2053191 RepID=A0A917IG78_9MICO|nr:GNAT family N-acetyltransferase [Microbacterium album]GGH45999.1 N-acetyltransferase [Microbacterium album]